MTIDVSGTLRVVVVAPPFYEVPPAGYGGVERVCHALVEGLVDAGHDVCLVGAGRPGTRARFFASAQVAPTEAVPDPDAVMRRHALYAGAVIAEVRPDIVHDHTASVMAPAVSGTSPCVVVTVHCALSGPDSHAGLYRHALARHPGTALVAISRSQVVDAPDLPWAGCVPNGLRLMDGPKAPSLGPSRDYVLFLGRLSATKGVHLAVEAAQKAGYRLVIAGEPTSPGERDYTETVLRPLLRRPGVEWVGPVDEAAKQRVLAGAGCLVMPVMWHEPFGLVVAEAMAAGVPVVALRAGSMPELVEDGRTGYLCDVPADLPAAITAAMTLDGRDCRAWAQEHLAAHLMVQRYLQIYRTVLARRRGH